MGEGHSQGQEKELAEASADRQLQAVQLAEKGEVLRMALAEMAGLAHPALVRLDLVVAVVVAVVVVEELAEMAHQGRQL